MVDLAKIVVIKQLRASKECQTISHDIGPHSVLQEIHQSISVDHCAYGKIVEKGCDVLLG